jgi:hypothetical protein
MYVIIVEMGRLRRKMKGKKGEGAGGGTWCSKRTRTVYLIRFVSRSRLNAINLAANGDSPVLKWTISTPGKRFWKGCVRSSTVRAADEAVADGRHSSAPA